MTVEHLNPETLVRNPAFTQAIAVSGSHRQVFVGGQDAVDASGNMVGSGDLAAQTRQVLRNVRAALEAGGAGIEHLVRCNVYVVAGQDLQQGFAAFQEEWSDLPDPPTISVLFVAGLAHPDFLVEVDALAVVPETEAAG